MVREETTEPLRLPACISATSLSSFASILAWEDLEIQWFY
jgi:hypothetical protein